MPNPTPNSGPQPSHFWHPQRWHMFGLVLLVSSICIAQAGREGCSTIQGATIRMRPSAASFKVPHDWRSYRTAEELKTVRSGGGEWDTEYAKVINAALPFKDCAVHAGGEGWANAGASFGDLQMRGYVSKASMSEVEKRISDKGFFAAKSLPPKTASGAAINKDEVGQWHRIRITYDLWYGDYGGKANVEFYVSRHGGWTVVLVFMHADAGKQAPTIQQILQSFSWN